MPTYHKIFMNMKQILFDKVMLLNAGVMTLSFVEIESLLKIVLLIISIIYTIIKIIYQKEGNPELNKRISEFFSNKDKKSDE